MLAFIRALLQLSRYIGVIWQLALFIILGLAPVLQRYLQQRRTAAAQRPEAQRPTIEGDYQVLENEEPPRGTPRE